MRIPLVVLLLAASATRVAAQPLAEVGHYGENIGTVAVDGTKGVINEGTRIRVVDLSTPTSPSFRGSVAVGTVPKGMFVVGNYAYVAGYTGSFSVVNITNMDAPTVSGSVDWEAWKNAVWVRRSEDYAYLGVCSTVEVIDVRNKTSPVRVRSLGQMNFCVESITGDGGYLYVVTDTPATRVRIYSLVDPSNPFLISVVPGNDIPSRRPNCVAVFGDVLYLGQEDGTQAYDIADRAAPRLIGRVEPEDRYYETAMDVDRGLLYVADWERMNVWQLSSPDSPTAFTEIWGGPAHQVTQVAAFSGLALAARTYSLTLSNPTSGASADVRSITPGVGWGGTLAAQGSTIYLGTGPGLATFSISDPTHPALAKYLATRWWGDAEVVADTLYNLSPWGALEVYDVTTPTNPTYMADYPISGGLDSLRVSGTTTLVAATAAEQLVVYSRATDGLLTERSRTTLPTSANAVALSGTIAFVALPTGVIRIYDLTNPAAPSLVTTRTVFATGEVGGITDAEVVGSRLHVLLDRRGYGILDITTPNTPVVLGTYPSSEMSGSDIAVDGNLVYLATFGWNGRRGIRALNVTTPSSIQEVATTTASGLTRAVVVASGYVYCAEDKGALRVRNLVAAPAGLPNGFLIH